MKRLTLFILSAVLALASAPDVRAGCGINVQRFQNVRHVQHVQRQVYHAPAIIKPAAVIIAEFSSLYTPTVTLPVQQVIVRERVVEAQPQPQVAVPSPPDRIVERVEVPVQRYVQYVTDSCYRAAAVVQHYSQGYSQNVRFIQSHNYGQEVRVIRERQRVQVRQPVQKVVVRPGLFGGRRGAQVNVNVR